MSWRSIAWPWRAAALGIAAGAALQLLVPIANQGTGAALLLADLPIRWFYPGREAASLLGLFLLLGKVPIATVQIAQFAAALVINAGLFVAAWAFARKMLRGGVWHRATLIAAGGFWFVLPLVFTIAFVAARALLTSAAR